MTVKEPSDLILEEKRQLRPKDIIARLSKYIQKGGEIVTNQINDKLVRIEYKTIGSIILCIIISSLSNSSVITYTAAFNEFAQIFIFYF